MRPISNPDPSHASQDAAVSAAVPDRLSAQLRSFGRLWPYLWPKGKWSYKLRTFFALTFTLAGQFVLVGAPFFLGRAQDAVGSALGAGTGWNAAWLTLAFLIFGYGGLRLLSTLISEAREYLFTPVGQFAQRSVATATFAHLHQLSLRYHLEKRTGGLSRIIERGVRSVDFLFRFLLFNIGPTLLQLVIAGAAFWLAYDWRFALIAIAVVLTYITFTVMTTEWRLKFRREMNDQDTKAMARAVDSLLNYETVKYFAAEQTEVKRYDGAMEAYQNAAIKSRTSLATVNIGQALLMNIGLMAMMLLAAFQILDGKMSVGDMTTITLVMSQLYQPLNILGFAYREIKQSLTDMDKMFTLLDLKPEVQDAPQATPLTSVKGEIVFDNVHFAYEPDRQILKGVSFTAKAGQTVAIVGPTGAGKSTLSRILYRFYDISSGSVRIDGQDISNVTQNSLRGAIGIVPQDTVLFNASIGYNIGYAKEGATQAQIEQAARDAQIHDFIAGLPLGYDTVVGERGLKLSGGEKQRVAIARTLLKNPPILILDEATSALDSATERDIQGALEIAARARTTLVIAHRLTTITGADQILVMEGGKIVQSGTHDALLKSGGLYAELWNRQESQTGHTEKA